ncbi:hypothetical protein [Paenibacillus sp. WLX2291]|uniref:hypothetical protein n=1 Tax=Paenibacillus sp. WLX2291 TaxID=3296934 RepID=UPI003983F79C
MWMDRHFGKITGVVVFLMIMNFLLLHTGWNVLLGMIYVGMAAVHYRDGIRHFVHLSLLHRYGTALGGLLLTGVISLLLFWYGLDLASQSQHAALLHWTWMSAAAATLLTAYLFSMIWLRKKPATPNS